MTDDLRPVELETWSEFYMALRAVLAELPPGTELLLRPAGDARTAHVRARPEPSVEIRAGDRRLAALPCRTETDIIEHVRTNLEEHWALDGPTELEHAFSSDVAPRLLDALIDGALIGDLPEVESPRPSSHVSGAAGDGDLASRLDPEMLERLRRMGRS
jgi:hypothetical protein